MTESIDVQPTVEHPHHDAEQAGEADAPPQVRNMDAHVGQGAESPVMLGTPDAHLSLN